MKNWITKLTSLAVVLSLCLLCFSDARSISAMDGEDPFGEIGNLLMEQQENALIAYEQLTTCFEMEESGKTVYPDSYGGCYIDNGILHINVVGEDTSFYESLIDDLAFVQFNQVKYSYNDLYDLANAMGDECASIEAYVDEKDNKAVIGFAEGHNPILSDVLNSDSVQNFAAEYEMDLSSASVLVGQEDVEEITLLTDRDSFAVLDLPIEIVKSESPVSESELWYGDKISSITISSTIGGTGRYQPEPVGPANNHAIVTCGHGTSMGTSFNYNGTNIGNVVFHRYMNNAYGDFSIILLQNTNHETSPKGFGPSGSTSSPILVKSWEGSCGPVGTVVYKYGAVSKWAVMKVKQRDTTITYADGTKLRGMIKSTITSGSTQPGDSGGPYYIKKNGRYLICGIHSGSNGKKETYHTPLEIPYINGFRPLTHWN